MQSLAESALDWLSGLTELLGSEMGSHLGSVWRWCRGLGIQSAFQPTVFSKNVVLAVFVTAQSEERV